MQNAARAHLCLVREVDAGRKVALIHVLHVHPDGWPEAIRRRPASMRFPDRAAPLFAVVVAVQLLVVTLDPVRADDSAPGSPDVTITLRNISMAVVIVAKVLAGTPRRVES
jgi:hypothetical protein